MSSSPLPGRRRFSRPLFFYVLREFLVICGLCIAAFLTMFLISALFDDLEDLLRHGAPWVMVLRYFMLLVPDYLVATLPMSLLLASMYTVATLVKHNELTAMRASGVSLVQTSLPILLVALIGMVVQFTVAESLAPDCRRRASQLFDLLVSGGTSPAEERADYLAFRNKDDRRDWLFGDFTANGTCRNVVITQFRPNGTVEMELRADEAAYTPDGWRFTRAEVKHFDQMGAYPEGAPERHETLLREDFREDPGGIAFILRMRPVETLSLRQMIKILGYEGRDLSASTVAIIRTYVYYRIAMPLACLIGVLLGVPLAVTPERGATMRSVVLAAGLMVSYLVLSQFFLMLGKKQLLPPAIAGLLPSLFFVGWGMWETSRKL